MARTKAELPPFRVHKATQQGYVNLDNERVYLGRADDPATKKRYDRTVAEWLANGRRRQVAVDDLMLVELCARFIAWADGYYRNADGSPSKHAANFAAAIVPLRELYDDILAKDFGPVQLKAVREALVRRGLSRGGVNRGVGMIRRVFKWGVSEGLVDVRVHGALLTVEGLRRGRTPAHETPPVRPVGDDDIAAIKPHVSRQVWGIVQLQRLTGARGGEIIVMRPKDLDMTGRIWLYRPASHKGEWRGHDRVIYCGPRAQAVIREFLVGRAVDAYMFSPKEAERERWAKCPTHRHQPVVPAKTDRELGDCYNTDSYGRAIARACALAKIKPWHPHRLRHSAATALRKEFNLETARVILGHRSPAISAMYAEFDETKAVEAMELVG